MPPLGRNTAKAKGPVARDAAKGALITRLACDEPGPPVRRPDRQLPLLDGTRPEAGILLLLSVARGKVQRPGSRHGANE